MRENLTIHCDANIVCFNVSQLCFAQMRHYERMAFVEYIEN